MIDMFFESIVPLLGCLGMIGTFVIFPAILFVIFETCKDDAVN